MSQSNFDKLTALGIPLKFGTQGQTKTICPKCSHNRKPESRREACVSVNVTEGIYNCKNPGCDFHGTVNPKDQNKKYYVRPKWTNATQLSDGLVQYWSARGISQQTLINIRLAEAIEWMPYPGGEIWTMQFPYFRDGEIINVKYRGEVDSGEKKPDGSIIFKKSFKLVKDAELIFFNLDAIKDAQECLVVEGEPDCISFIEAGYAPVVSVPNGASKSKNNKLEYLDNCIDYFENKTKIYIGVDNDEPGRALQAELIRRLGAERCWIINYGDCKDGNEYLCRYGKFALMALFASAKAAEIDGIMEANDVRADVIDLWHNGLPAGETIGIKEIDEHISFLPGQFTVVSGIPSHGKSQLLDFILERLAVVKGWKIGYFTPEAMPLKLFISKLIQKITGKSFDKKFGYTNRVTLEEVGMAMDFIQNHFFFVSIKQKGEKKESGYSNEFVMPNYSLENILALGKKMVVRYGINALVIDPWNKLTHLKSKNFNETDDILDKLNEIVFFGESNQVHMFLVAHPTKMKKDKDGKYEIPTLYDVSGSAHFYNVAYNGFTVYRDFDLNETWMCVQKIKLDWLGKVGKIKLIYDPISGRYNPDAASTKDSHNHLLVPPMQQGYNEPSSVIGIPPESPVIVADNNETKDGLPF